MDKVVARRLRPWESRTLHQMKRQTSNAVNSRHARMILLSVGGVRNRDIAERAGCTPTLVRRIIHRFNDGDIEAIEWYPYYCRRDGPRKFVVEVMEQIAEIALSPPRQLIGMSIWSLSKLRAYLIEQKLVRSISLEWLRQILRRRRIRWRHTKTWKESQDPEFWRKYRRIKRLSARPVEGGVRLSIDEFGPLNLLPRHGKHYASVGHVDRLRATYRRTGGVEHFFGVYDLDRDTLRGQFSKKKNRKTFLSFLKWLRRDYRDAGTLHIVLDNVGYHKTSEVLAYAAANDIKFYWTPTNASWLNRIECHFTAMKKFALDNADYRSHGEQQRAIKKYLSWRNHRRKISETDWTKTKPHRRTAA